MPHQFWFHHQTGTFGGRRLGENLSTSEFIYQGWPLSFDLHFDESSKAFVKVVPDLSVRALSSRYLYFAKEEIGRLIYLLGPRALTVSLLIVGGILFFKALARRRTDALWQAVLLSPLLVLPFLHIEDRYLLPALPVLSLWMVSGALAVGKWVSRQIERSQARVSIKPVWVLGIVAALLLGDSAYRLATLLPLSRATLLPQQAAAWMQAERLPEGKIIAQEPALAFYKGSLQVWLPFGPFDPVLGYAREHEARYVFVSSQDATNPLKDRLLNDNEPPHDLLLLQTFQNAGETARLFELRPETKEPVIVSR